MSRHLLLSITLMVLGFVLLPASIAAHHSEAAEFDNTQPVRVKGTVMKVEWMNPHVWYYVEGTDEVSGRTAVWGFSAAAPNSLRRRGVGRDAMKVGDIVQVEGYLARDGSPNASGGRVTFEDGRQVFTATPGSTVPD